MRQASASAAWFHPPHLGTSISATGDPRPRVALGMRPSQFWIMSSTVLELQRRVIRAMSAEQRIRACEALRRTAWDLKAAWVRSQLPVLPEADVQDA
jgi:hypothetical protein